MIVEVFGHRTQRQALARLLRRETLPSTMLFCGPAGIGKTLVARELAATLFCKKPSLSDSLKPCGVCQFCELLQAGNHPDFYFLSEDSDTEKLRGLLYNLSLKPFYGHRRVIIINQADKLNIQCANLLLKSLEEPRADTYFILVATNRFAMPSTLLSRCQIWFFDSLAQADLDAALAKSAVTPEMRIVDDMVDGSIANIFVLQENKVQIDIFRTAITEALTGNLAAATKLASDLAKDKEALSLNLDILRLCVRQMMLVEPDSNKKTRLAVCLTNLVQADYYIFQRYLAPLGVLGLSLATLHSEEINSNFSCQPFNSIILSEQLV